MTLRRAAFDRSDASASDAVDVTFSDWRTADVRLPARRSGFFVTPAAANEVLGSELPDLSAAFRDRVSAAVISGGHDLVAVSERFFTNGLGASRDEASLLVDALYPRRLDDARPGRVAMIETAEVIVVGAGVQGASLAFHLAGRGVRVLVLERETVAAGATGRSSGFVRMHYDLASDARLAWASFPYFEDWAGMVGHGDCGFVRTGFLQIMPADLAASRPGQHRGPAGDGHRHRDARPPPRSPGSSRAR